MVPSRRSYLAFINFTEHDIEVVNYGVDAWDWDDGDARPDKQFPPWTIVKPFKRIERILETADRARRCDVKIDIRFKTAGPLGEKMQTLQFDQRDAFSSAEGIGVLEKTSSSEMQVDCYRIAYGEWQFVMIVPWMTINDTANWTKSLPDDRSIFHILLPGTHDSAAHGADVARISTQCQSEEFWRMQDQLDRGIRAFDLRFKIDGDSVISQHGGVNLGYSASEIRIFEDIANWLLAHPREFCVAKVRGDSTTLYAVERYYNRHRACFWNEKRWPNNVGEARGKCIILSEGFVPRENEQPITGLLGEQNPGDYLWGDNIKDQRIRIAGKTVQVQDNYELKTHKAKFEQIDAMLKKSMGLGPGSDADWFFNWTSASYTMVPWDFANGLAGQWGMNRWLLYRLCRYELQAPMSAVDFAGNRWTPRGIIFMDYYREPNKNWSPCVLPQVMLALNRSYKFDTQKPGDVRITIGSWAGGMGGGEFNTQASLRELDNKQIAEIRVRCGNRVDAIKLRWWNRNNNPGSIDGKWQGGPGGGEQSFDTGGHRIVRVEGYADHRINQLQFFLHDGGFSRRFGDSTAGQRFVWESKEKDGALLGFQGRSGNSVDGLAPIWVSNSEYAREHG
ncbi:hypothetical protein N0V91_011143 [Didymella pomorum]|uniref:Jacalin-type lectin domain-containing protein n=1 Tax=Didymella pomorum TaxID=749634 RepID=A0A9W9CZC4_9PLEO|nr:hypothetical protein N0V91_011143 [Didymella pomorum]